jgi:uncharacterized membrane protein YphA (DoxX/SURF4 family)
VIIALWIVNIVLGLVFIAAGTMKAITPKPVLADRGMAWTETYAPATVKLIAIAEVIGGVGLILPVVTGIAPILAPIAAPCLAVIMVGAVVTHIRRKESATPSVVLLVLSVVSAVLGFAVYA